MLQNSFQPGVQYMYTVSTLCAVPGNKRDYKNVVLIPPAGNAIPRNEHMDFSGETGGGTGGRPIPLASLNPVEITGILIGEPSHG
jgi:hypothetical protein